ncbi:uncharacterized protein PITG_10268 [Phytophthora infestans T30-4]|uniref:Uncharacterized protein n=1 Tax=Phytophthora infestans (strain T30-4) TaxID=403677 RepID=D0NEX7_PHYIT|nr:uncharacterized protein PITG_10268 [Phytophthora infestans T30-4]EEY56766.1 hypothetical protein PITG_10268 [Phytophthora infestans T30-4]|eukprot:XP_002902094.1 hypothetical protein PITG_10268 [Phytophthora infestans T30-4]
MADERSGLPRGASFPSEQFSAKYSTSASSISGVQLVYAARALPLVLTSGVPSSAILRAVVAGMPLQSVPRAQSLTLVYASSTRVQAASPSFGSLGIVAHSTEPNGTYDALVILSDGQLHDLKGKTLFNLLRLKVDVSIDKRGFAINASEHSPGAKHDISKFKDCKVFHLAKLVNPSDDDSPLDDGPLREKNPNEWSLLAYKGY